MLAANNGPGLLGALAPVQIVLVTPEQPEQKVADPVASEHVRPAFH